jgi:hypothetical protein
VVLLIADHLVAVHIPVEVPLEVHLLVGVPVVEAHHLLVEVPVKEPLNC